MLALLTKNECHSQLQIGSTNTVTTSLLSGDHLIFKNKTGINDEVQQ